MNNKKYLDKVIGSLVRGTKIDYENEKIQFPFSHPHPLFSHSLLSLLSLSPLLSYPHLSPLHLSFSNYCKNTFGLTEEEVEYVWEEYKSIILDKISNREP